MIWNQHLLYQIIDVWYHIRKLYLINNEKNDKIKLNHFFYKRRPISVWWKTYFPKTNISKFSERASNFPGFSLAVWEHIHREAGNEAGRISHSEVPGPLSPPRGGQRKFRGYWVKKVDNFTFIFPIPYKTTKRKRHKTREKSTDSELRGFPHFP